MANEFSLTLKGTLVHDEHKETWGDTSANHYSQSGIGAHAPVVLVGYAAEEDVPYGDVVYPGLLYLKNLDDTNYVTCGPKIGGTGVMEPATKIRATMEHWFELSPGSIWAWQANSADVRVKMILFEL